MLPTELVHRPFRVCKTSHRSYSVIVGVYYGVGISKNVCKLRTLPCLSTHPHRYPSLIGRFRRSADEPIPYLTFSHYYFIFRISIYSYLIIIFVSIFLNLRIRDRCFVSVTAFVLCRPADQMPDEIREAHRREALV